MFSKIPSASEKVDSFQPLFERFENISSHILEIERRMGNVSLNSAGSSPSQLPSLSSGSDDLVKKLGIDRLNDMLEAQALRQSKELGAFAEGIVFSNEQLAELLDKISALNLSELLGELKGLKELVSKQGDNLKNLTGSVVLISEELMKLKSAT